MRFQLLQAKKQINVSAPPPPKAADPTPSIGATNQSTTVNLSWSGGATSYDVYFGTDSTPDSGESKGNQSGRTYNPGTLQHNTTYYWRINAKNAQGTTTGDVWRFTTAPPPPPLPATDPTPLNGATNQPTTISLSWSDGGGATSYDVYFGTDSTPDAGESKGNQSGLTYNPGTLQHNTTYYWRIDAKNAQGTTAGDVWRFTTIGAPVVVTSPNGGETWYPETFPKIVWTPGASAGSDVKIELYKGGIFDSTIAGSTLNDGSYMWSIPSSWPPGLDYAIKITSLVNPSDFDDSDSHFGIVTSPSGYAEDFESYAVGEMLHGQGGWKGWNNNSDVAALASDLYAFSGSKSVEITGSADLVREFKLAGGKWKLSAMLYIPTGATGESMFILLNTYNDSGAKDWSVQLTFDSGSITSKYDDTATDTVLYDQWVELKCIIDLDNNTVAEYYNGALFSARQWDDDGHDTLGAIDLYAKGGSPVFYDDITIVPATACDPYPADGARYGDTWAMLEWSPGAFAASHDVYFGDSFEDVNGSAEGTFVGNLTDTFIVVGVSGSPSPDGLVPGKTYYWRIDEVNHLDPDSPWKGYVWSFTAVDSLVVDDFEDYSDFEPDRIFDVWKGGLDTPANGSLIGHENPPFAEQTIVHGGSQSMPFVYDNSTTYSEAQLTLSPPHDWTEDSATELSLWFRGTSSNATERMYVVLNGTAVVYHNNRNATQIAEWTEWVIPLQLFADQGADLTEVTSIAIGFGDKADPRPGGAGMMFFDNIRIYTSSSAP
jgi:hypothetical protein